MQHCFPLTARDSFLHAIDFNDIAAATVLIESRAVDIIGYDNRWLHRAVEQDRLEIMILLLNAGAKINANDRNFFRTGTACDQAIYNNRLNALKVLVARGATLRKNYLVDAAKHREGEKMILFLLSAGARLEDYASSELLGLVRSVPVFQRLSAIVSNLIEMRDETGATLCHYVARNVAREDDLRLLIDACGGHINDGDSTGATPLYWATKSEDQRRNAVALRILVEMGANLDVQSDGWTTLWHAAWHNQSGCVELLLAVGADVGLIGDLGQTACHVATGPKKLRALYAIVAAGGDLDQPDNRGETSRMLAARRNVRLPTDDDIASARRQIAKTRLDLVRQRALEICVGLRPLDLNALQLCEILTHSFGALGSVVPFHQWWAIATTVKHFALS